MTNTRMGNGRLSMWVVAMNCPHDCMVLPGLYSMAFDVCNFGLGFRLLNVDLHIMEMSALVSILKRMARPLMLCVTFQGGSLLS